jgi:hypothetical protein
LTRVWRRLRSDGGYSSAVLAPGRMARRASRPA